MKKTILLIVTLLFLTGVSAQSFIIKDKEGNNITSTTVDLLCAPATGLASFKLDVLNNTSVAKNVSVRKYEISMLPGVDGLSICWLSCYPPFIFEAPDPIIIEPGAVCTNFEGDLTYATGLNGTSTAKFVFFDIDNPTDTSFVIVNYNIGTIGKPENMVKNSKVSNAYPNPAASTVYFDYKLPASVTDAKIKISNLLGTTVKVVDLQNNEGKAGIDVNGLKNGVYFYTILVNNTTTITKKFVVNR